MRGELDQGCSLITYPMYEFCQVNCLIVRNDKRGNALHRDGDDFLMNKERLMNMAKKTNRGFTLVEILIVVIILGILAAIVIPQFANASSDARLTNLRTSLANVRNQIEI